MPQRNFLFVNKDSSSQSLTRSSINEQTNINSHVQRGRRHVRSAYVSSRRRPTASSKEKSPTTTESSLTASSPSNSSTSSGSVPIRTSGFSTFSIKQDVSPTTTISPDSATSQRKFTFENTSYDQSAAQRLQTAQQVSDDLISIASPAAQGDSDGRQTSPTTAPTSVESSPHDVSQLAVSTIDPFQQASVRIDFKTHQLLEYYKHVYHPAVWNAETRASPKGSYAFQTSVAEVIQSALASDVDMYALLAAMQSRREFIDKQPVLVSTDDYLGKALAATRKLLIERAKHEPKSNEAILMIIFHLYAAEGYRNNAPAAKIHMKGAKNIVQCIGGLDKLRDPQMRELLITGDGLLSAMTLSPCELPGDFDPGSYLEATPPELRFAVDRNLDSIASALRHRPSDSIIPHVMADLIDEVAEISWVLLHSKEAAPEEAKHAMRWLQIRNMAVRHKLLGLVLDDPRLDTFRAALVLWIVTSTTLLGAQRLCYRISPQLKAKLEAARALNYHWQADADVLAWILCLGAMCTIPGSPEADWFIQELMQSLSPDQQTDAPINETTVFDNLSNLQSRFFYHEPVYGSRAKALAAKLASFLALPNSVLG